MLSIYMQHRPLATPSKWKVGGALWMYYMLVLMLHKLYCRDMQCYSHYSIQMCMVF